MAYNSPSRPNTPKKGKEEQYTNGDLYMLEDGTPYIGYYHIMDDGTIMSGKYHDEGDNTLLINIDLKLGFNKIKYPKESYEKVINNEFTQLGVSSIQDQINNQPTVEEFFETYNELFYEIPETGETNSHEFIIKQSSEYINFDDINEEIQELQKEITQLREDLLEAQKQVVELQTGTSLD